MESSRETEKTFDALVEKFVFLLRNSGHSELKQKELLDSLPNLSLEAIDELLEELEVEYTNQQTSHLEVKLEEQLNNLAENFRVKQLERDRQLLLDLEKLSSSLD